ncbi:hypothetical protein [Salinibacter ruber]|uniref:hypothetical protein n=1 Tax=Salinibacter ruber TaxID=146919 RepID=UPI0024513015|nr:hypothetical protein [Salinibacter ruber]
MTLRTATRWIYGWRGVHTTPRKVLHPEQVGSSIDDLSRIHLIRGHVAYGVHEYVSAPCRYFTLVRDPVARVISLYYYIKRGWPDSKAASLSLDEYIESNHHAYVPNDQTRRLAGPPFLEEGSDPSLLSRAKEHLDAPNVTVGLTERFDAGLILMKRKLDWRRQPLYVRTNTGGSRPSKSEIDPEVRDRIRAQNRLDLQLYEYATERFKKTISSFPEFDEEVRRFQKKTAALSKVGSLLTTPYRYLKAALSP